MQFILLSIAALIPLVIVPGVFFNFDITPKIAILLVGTAVMLALCKRNVKDVRTLLGSPLGRWFVALLLAQWLSVAASALLSTNRAFSLNGSGWRRSGALVETALLIFAWFSAAWFAADRERIRGMLRATSLAGALASLYGIAQYFGWDPLQPSKAYEVGEGVFAIVRPPGTLGHADYFATWLVMVVFFAVALRGVEHSGARKAAATAIAGLAVFAIILSGTRSALLGLAAGALVLLLSRRPNLRLAMYGAAGVACLTIFFFSPAGVKLRARVHWSIEDARGGARFMLWRDSLRMASRRPILGFGEETFASEFPRYESIELARAYPDFYHESPHNMFLDALTARGAVGGLLLVGLSSLGLWSCHRAWRSHPFAVPLGAALAATLVCQQFMVFIVPTALYYWMLLAMLVAIATPPALAREPRRISMWLAAPAALAAGLVFTVLAVRLTVADHALAVAIRRIESGDARGAAESYRMMLRWRPSGAGADLAYSRAMAGLAARTPIFTTRLEAWQQAVDAGARATTTSEDRQNAWYNLATLLVRQEDAPAVERCLRQAIACAPNWFKPHWTLAPLLDLTGRHAEALAEAAAALDLDGGHDPEVRETWQKLIGARH